MLGTLDGHTQGIIPMLKTVAEQSKENGEAISEVKDQIKTFQLDRAKVAGIIIACSVMFGAIYKYFLK